MTAVERLLFDGADPARPPLRGNRGDYYDAENSLVDAIFERRLGIPISIASVFVAVCVRAGVRDDAIAPVNAPGHFPCGIQIFNPTSIVEGFIAGHNGLSLAHARASLDAALRSRPTPADVCRRALRNLAAIYDDDPAARSSRARSRRRSRTSRAPRSARSRRRSAASSRSRTAATTAARPTTATASSCWPGPCGATSTPSAR
ncbi:glycosyltransferase [Aureococcus anophagefferens]|nr:glycosyltransferase [Aureococcus anophagefferens]